MVLSVVVALFAAEVGLRVGTALFTPRYTKVDPVLGWNHYPNTAGVQSLEGHEYQLTYNQHGFRVPEVELERTCGVLRVIVLGDSFVDGSEVGDTETFTWRLNEMFPDIEVVNLGVYGYSTAQESILLDTVGRAFQPDLVMVLTMPNDLWNNVVNFSFFGPSPRFVVDGDSLLLEGTDHPNALEAHQQTNLPGPSFLHRNSFLHYLLNHYFYQLMIRDRIDTLRAQQIDAVSETNKRELYFRIIERIAEDSREMDADLRVVLGYTRGRVRDTTFTNEPMVEGLSEAGVQVIDLLDQLRLALPTAPEPLYYEHDSHWTAAGHEVVADFLSGEIQAWREGLDDERRASLLARGCRA